jgi:ribosomal protein S26
MFITLVFTTSVGFEETDASIGEDQRICSSVVKEVLPVTVRNDLRRRTVCRSAPVRVSFQTEVCVECVCWTTVVSDLWSLTWIEKELQS